MRFLLASVVLLLSLALVSASHVACWEDKGSPTVGGTGKDFITGQTAVYVLSKTSSFGIPRARLSAFLSSGTWTSYSNVTGLDPKALGISAGYFHIAGEQSYSCPEGITPPCAKIKKVLSNGTGVDSSFTVSGFSAAQRAAVTFKRFVMATGKTYIFAEDGVAFEQPGSCRSDWCGQHLLGEEWTAFAADGDGALVGTNMGNLYRIGPGLTLEFRGRIGSAPIAGIVKAPNGYTYVILRNGEAYFFAGVGSWTRIGSGTILSPYGFAGLVEVSNSMASGTALYTIDSDSGTTYAFMNTSTTAESLATTLGENTRILKAGGGVVWAYSISANKIYKFNCAASPSIAHVGSDATIPFGGNFSLGYTNDLGFGAGHQRLGLVLVFDPPGLSPYSIFQSFGGAAGGLTYVNATRNGTFVMGVATYYSAFPRLNNSDSLVLTVSPPVGPAPAAAPAGEAPPAEPVVGEGEGAAPPAEPPAAEPPVTPAPTSVEEEPPAPVTTEQQVQTSGEQPPQQTVASSAACTSSSQCADDQSCANGSCTPLSCTGGRIPIAHQCSTICVDSGDCAVAEACVQGACRQLSCESPSVAADHECISTSNLVQCSGFHNKNRGVCCNNQWVAGETQCPAPVAGGAPGLLSDIWFIAGVAIVVLLVLAALVYIFTHQQQNPFSKAKQKTEEKRNK